MDKPSLSAPVSRVELPPALRAQFEALRRSLHRRDRIVAGAGAGGSLLVSYLLLAVSDRLWNSPVWLRAACVLGGLAAAMWFAWRYHRIWGGAGPDEETLARLVQRHYRGLGDRLLGIVELALDRHRPQGMSEGLCRAAIRQVADSASGLDFGQAADPRPARRQTRLCWAAALPVVVFWLLAPGAGWVTFKRWLVPVSGTPRFTFVHLAPISQDRVVPRGEPFQVSAEVRYRGWWQPSTGVARLGLGPAVAAEVREGRLTWELPGIVEETSIQLELGDALDQLRVKPVSRPGLRELQARIQLPAYLERGPMTNEVLSGSLRYLRGSRVSLRGQTTRALKTAWFEWDEGVGRQDLEVDAAAFSTAALELDLHDRLTLGWVDTLGLDQASPWPLSLAPLEDVSPTIALPGLGQDTGLLETDVLPIRIAGTDDFGLLAVGLRWQPLVIDEAAPASSTPAPGEFRHESVVPDKTELEQTYLLSPSVLGLGPGAEIEIRGFALDALPGREPVLTRPFRVRVVGLVEHAEAVRQRLEGLFGKLEEVTRGEEGIAEGTRELARSDREKLQEPEAAAEAGRQAGRQEENNNRLKDVVSEGLEAVREAVRNPVFDPNTLREWAKNLRDMQKLAQGSMSQAAQEMAQARDQPEQREDSLDEAVQAMEESLRQLQELQQRMAGGLDNLQALTLAQRLRREAESEDHIYQRLGQVIPETIGLRPAELPDPYQRINLQLVDRQGETREAVETIREEMSRFHERTRREQYGAVSQEMQEKNVTAALESVSGLILENIAMRAMGDLETWRDQLLDWAERLEPEPQKDSAGGGQNGGGDQDQLVNLLLEFLRMRQSEHNLHQRTQLLETSREDLPNHEEASRMLGEDQAALRQHLQDLREAADQPVLVPPMAETGKAMFESETALHQAETGAPAEEPQVRAVTLLTDLVNLINEQSRQQSQNPASQQQREEIEFLLQMVQQQQRPGTQTGKQPGDQPGMANPGGTTDRAGAGPGGSAEGPGTTARRVAHGAGRSEDWPAEYRGLLQQYFRALEAGQQQPPEAVQP